VVNDEDIKLGISPDEKSFEKAFDSLNASAGKAANDATNTINKSFGGIGLGIKSALAGVAGIIGGAFAFNKIIEAGIESEAAVNRFNIALQNSGKFTAQASADFQNFASSLEVITNIQDEVILGGAALITNLSGLSGAALKNATKASLDLGAALNIGPEAAFNLVAKAATGNTAALGKYGIKIDESVPKSERFAEALKQIEKFSGSAAASQNTFGGALSSAQNAFSNVIENIGLLIVKSPSLIAVVKEIGTRLQAFAESVSKLDGKFIDNLVIKFFEYFNAFITYVVAPLEVFKNASMFAFSFIAGAIQEGLIIPLALAAEGFARAGNVLGLVSDETMQGFIDAKDIAVGALDEINTKTLELGNTITSTPIADSLRATSLELQTVAIEHQGAVVAVTEATNKGLDDSANKASITAASINKTFNGALASGISSSVAAMTKSIASGKNAMEAFGKAIVSIIGDIAIQMGQFFIAQGIAQLALASNPLTAGGAIIAAGVGLVVLGTLLKGAGGGGEGLAGGAGASTGAGAGAGSFSDSAITSAPEDVNTKVGSSISVNVQGSVFDRRETGLVIAEVIRESFDTSGTNIVGAV
jgi:hypothetical protein